MDRTVHILGRREVFNRFIFRIEEVTLKFERFDGSMSKDVTRLLLDRGDSVAILLHDPSNDVVLLCEQFRVPTFDRGPGWLLELPAGMLESGESEEECTRREALEETGYRPSILRRIACVYLSPGGSSERTHIFYSTVFPTDHIGIGGGVPEEDEDIRLIIMPRDQAIEKAKDGQILDAKTLIALQWLELQGPSVPVKV